MPAVHRILIADPIHEKARSLLASRPGFEVAVATGLNETELVERIGDYDGIIVRSKTRVTAAVVSAGHQRLKVIGRAGIGVDNIDVAAATEWGIVVLNTPDANATTTAELALAHLLSLSRHLPQADRSVRAGEWQPAKFVGTELSGKSVGVIGFGTIGRIFARRCLALKMQVLAYDPFVTPEIIEEAGAEPVTLDALLARADYVSLHCPLTDQTRNLIDTVRLAQMKPGACLINCARGALVDEAALCDALQSDHLAGAALDVYAHEPPKDSPLLALDTVVLTPHLGASTKEAQQAVSVKIAEDMAAFFTTGEAASAVNLPRISAEQLVRSRPYQNLAHALGGVIAAMTPDPITEIEVGLFGRAAELDPRPITSQALVGLLDKRLDGCRQPSECHAARAATRNCGARSAVRGHSRLHCSGRGALCKRLRNDERGRNIAGGAAPASRSHRRLRGRSGARGAHAVHPPRRPPRCRWCTRGHSWPGEHQYFAHAGRECRRKGRSNRADRHFRAVA